VPGDCNPLGPADACLVPWPSSYFQVDDPTSATGMRNAVSIAAMPKNINKKPIDPRRVNRLDGFSPATPLVLYFPAGVDISGLATLRDFSPSLTADAKLQLFDMSTGERVDYFAELDANAADGGTDRQAMLVHPQHRLKPATKYAVAVLASLAPPSDAFLQARDGKLNADSALWTMKDRYDVLFTFLEKQGLKRGDLGLAWDFTTASEDMITGRLVRMRDRALAAASFDYHVDSAVDVNDGGVLREIQGTFMVPSFLASDAGNATLPLDAGTDPAIIAQQPFPFVVHVPECAQTATSPLPVMIYGHGLLNSALGELNDNYQGPAADRLCMVQVATNWLGLSEDDIPTLVQYVGVDLSHFDMVTDRLMQAQVNTVVLARLVKTKLKDDPALKLGAVAVTDASQLYYEGISLGGIEGTTFMALTPDIDRGVTHVAGCEWSLMMSRSSDFSALAVVFDAYLPDKLDDQLAFAIGQSLWDETDPISYAPHLLHDPLPGVGAKKILLQESIGDAEVPNVATRLLARTEGQTALSPLVQSVPGLTEMTAPLESAYVQFDLHVTPLPPDADLTPDPNDAHTEARKLDVVLQQIGAFLKPQGSVQQFCTGTCDPN
jgi:hypothetical protein